MANVVPGWTMSPAAVTNYIEFDVRRDSLVRLIMNPPTVLGIDQGRTKYVDTDLTAIVNVAMKTILGIGIGRSVSKELRLRRLERFADLEEKQRQALLASEAPYVPHGNRLVRQVAPSPVQVSRMAPAGTVALASAPTSFASTTVEAYSQYWREFFKTRGM